MNPHIGDVTMGTITFQSNPLPLYHTSLSGTDQMTTDHLPAAASAAPHNPPIMAWLELEGMPKYHVIRFQTIPPSSAQISTSFVMEKTFESSSPDEIVLATAVPHIAPIRFVQAAIAIASRGVSTFVETTVAMELAVSWKPLMYSKTSATRTTVRISVIGPFENEPGPYEFLRTMWLMTLPASRQRSATFSRSSKMSLRNTTRMALPCEA